MNGEAKTYVKLFDFKIYNDNPFTEESDSEDEKKYKEKKDDKETIIQMFGMNETGETYSLYVTDFQPFFYVKVPDNWDKNNLHKFITQIKKEKNKNKKLIIGKYYQDSIVKGKLINKKTLYGFDNNKNYQFIQLVFKNTTVFNKVKSLWYTEDKDFRKRKLKCGGWHGTELYEAKLPPLLRYFHIQNISPSGWISFKEADIIDNEGDVNTCCDYEYWLDYKDIQPEREKEDAIPLKICSFDIEASSSHGDFPLAKKTYLKLCREIVNYWNKNEIKTIGKEEKEQLFKELVYTAFGYSDKEDISEIFLKKKSSKEKISKFIITILKDNIKKFKQWAKKETYSQNNFNDKGIKGKKIIFKNKDLNNKNIIALLDSNEDVLFKGEILNRIFTGFYNYSKITLFDNEDKSEKPGIIANIDNMVLDLDDDDVYKYGENKGEKKYTFIESNLKYNSSNIKPNICLPYVEGDKVTFIGSTFMRMGEKEQYKNNMIVLNSCSDCPEVPHCEIETYETEKEVLLAWTEMIQREDPDVIIGYNIFGFDYKFMIERSEELSCKDDFLKLSRNLNEDSRVIHSSIKIASGTHDLQYIEMTGRLQLDLYNYFRREVNLPSYKLDYVASHFIGDMISNIEYKEEEKKTEIHSKNLVGLKDGHYICFEILGHSNDMYRNGKKFIVEGLDTTEGLFKISVNISELKGKKFRWCMAKDDVTPQDIFRLTNEGPDERAIIAKYCFQDCNLVHNLMVKNDILTGMSEIANICYVPINFIIMRGQGIKLLSFIAKKCSEKNTLMPVLDVDKGDSSYEGAICLKPHCGLYIDNPVAVVDYASLYPSSMISENISHDSKVWTKEYNLDGNIVIDISGNPKIYGKQDRNGNFIYDNLPDYEYVDITYDRYIWRRKGAGKAQEKVKVGTKTCRFAQFPNNKKAIMPSVLQELLAGRKATRKFIKYKTVTTSSGETFSGLLKKKDTKYIVTGEKETMVFQQSDVIKVEDTYDDFMKNVFDKRQQGLKVTANSLYGQCGAKTSSFYEMDIAASTTATGRKLLIYGKKIIEGIYGNKICDTKYGKIRCKSKVVYGDSVTGDTPLLLKDNNGNIVFKQIDNLNNLNWESYEGFKINETNRTEKQQKKVNYKIYTSGGWSNIVRVIRHKTIKKIYRITTHTGMVDVTEDHSLLDESLNKVKPKDVKIGMKLCHNYPTFEKKSLKLSDIMSYIENIGNKTILEKKAFIFGFFYGDGSCGKYDCPSGKKYSWALNNKNIENCLILQSLCEEIFECNFKINDTIKSSGVYKVVPNCGNIKKFVDIFRNKFYNKDKYKIIPDRYLNCDYEEKLAYFSGYYWADGSKCHNENTKCIRMDNKGKIGSAMLYYFTQSLGFNVSLNTRKDKKDIIRLTATVNKQRKHPNIIKKIDVLGVSTGFVYDIETDVGNFNTGFPLIVKNTDSCFMTFNPHKLDGTKIVGKEALDITIELAIECGELASKFLKPPHDLEYEKTFDPFLLLSKKRYVGMLYETDINKCKRKSMGIVLKRRDNAPVVKDIYGGIIDIIMKEQNIEKSVLFTKQFLQDIIDEKIGLDKLIITKSLRGFYKNPESIAHKVLADRIGKRDPGNKPSNGSRIPYIFIQTDRKVKLQGDRIENPDYIKKHKLKPDYKIYITNQIMKPVTQIYALVLEELKIFKKRRKPFERKVRSLQRKWKDDEKKCDEYIMKERNKHVKELIFDDVLRIYGNKRNGQPTIQSMFAF